MPTISDIEVTPLSGLNHIDALLDTGPDWNFLTPAGNTIRYTFSVSSDNETGVTGQQVFSVSQQAHTRSALQYISSLTGIVFTEVANASQAEVHLATMNIAGSTTTGLSSWNTSYGVLANDTLVSYSVDAYVYLDNVEWGSRNADLTPGGDGYETLLHELGHMLGLKHPFDDAIRLPASQNNTLYTLMAYADLGGPYGAFRPYDVAALNWLYGGDGLGGALGINSTTGARYLTGSGAADTLTGTAFNDMLRGEAGDDLINGGDGNDTAVFSGTFASYAFSDLAGGALLAIGADGSDRLEGVEFFQFSDQLVLRAQLADTTPPPQPTLSTAKNANGYVVGDTPLLYGIAEAGSLVRLYNGASLIGSANADADGFWLANASPLADGSYSVVASATDSAGNVSASSAALAFLVDAHAPAQPSASVSQNGAGVISGNQPLISGTAEAGTALYLTGTLDGAHSVIAQLQVPASGLWSVTTNALPNGAYNFAVQSADLADNLSEAALAFSVSSTLNLAGSAANDILASTSGNNAISGLAGVDVALYGGARAGYTVSKALTGFTVTAASGSDGSDALYGVERIQFANTSVALDIDGTSGQAYRIYRAAFDRVPDEGGVGFWMTMMDRGVSLTSVAEAFLTSEEFAEKYGSNVSNLAFVTELYDNVLHRAPDGDGFNFWIDRLTEGVSRARVLEAFSESPENVAQVIGEIRNGFDYAPWLG